MKPGTHAYYVIRLSSGVHEAIRDDEVMPGDDVIAGYDCIDDARAGAEAATKLEREVRDEIDRRQKGLFDA